MKYVIRTKLVGVSFPNEDGTNRQDLIEALTINDTLTIEHEPENIYDANSHIVKHSGRILGHINRDLAKDLVKKVKEGQKMLGIKYFKKTGHDKQTIGLNIEVELDDGKEKQ